MYHSLRGQESALLAIAPDFDTIEVPSSPLRRKAKGFNPLK